MINVAFPKSTDSLKFFNSKKNIIGFKGKEGDLGRHVSSYVMGPLEIHDWDKFGRDLDFVKSKGVEGISLDVWWGKAEKDGDQKFNWKYYDKAFKMIKEKGLEIMPILSFHKCGGNVGDTVNIPLPEWVWKSVALTAKRENAVNPERIYNVDKKDIEAVKYRNEQGFTSDDCIPVWYDKQMERQYIEFMEAFKNHFGPEYKDSIEEINISLGPAGELRYPTYAPPSNGSLGELAKFPKRGNFVGYSKGGVNSFRDFVMKKYNNDIKTVRQAWELDEEQLRDKNDIFIPFDNTPEDGLAGDFVKRQEYKNSQYGKDFISWYNGSLVKHGKMVLGDANKVFNDGTFSKADIGFKIPGIHWQMGINEPGDIDNARIPEITAGLISTDQNYNSSVTDYGYNFFLNMASDLDNDFHSKNHNRRLVTHFTCIEKDNNPNDGNSLVKKLLDIFIRGAQDRKLVLKGENALSGGLYSTRGWDNIREATYKGLDGVTFLRLEDFSPNMKKDAQDNESVRDNLGKFNQWLGETFRNN